MDYDDNDFQSQNFQLSADDNKFPLPKFDIDEHLQVNLRFDSLVDTDILLGIQNQDNNWIEDFSSGTSAIEFNSNAAKTHTISRHTNVWSEATSSESVEMLLKSVGEDEMNNNKAIAMDSDLQNASNNLINPADPTLENDNDSSVMATFVQDDQYLQPDKVERNISDHYTDASREMLLKSVVEDEMDNDKPIAMESDNSDLENASNYLISPPNPTLENDNNSSAMATFVQDDQSLQHDEVERNTLDQNTDASGEMLSKSVGEDEMNNNKPIALEYDLQNASNNPISPVNPTPDNGNDMATIVQENPPLQPYKVERNISDQNTYASEEKLLKSVEEDEMNNNEPIAMESDNTDLENASSYIINPVDPTPENDNDSSTMATFMQDDPSLQPDEVETNMSDQNTDASVEARQCPESASDVFACHSDLNKDDLQTVSLASVEPTMDSFVLINDGRDVSEISENRDGLLEVVACQVEVSNESEAVETAGEKHTGIINQNEKEFGNIEAAREVNSPVDTNNPKTPKKFTIIENITGCGHSKIDMQTHETETAVEKRVEFNIVENDEESGSKSILQENAAQSISYDSVHNTTEDVASSVSTVTGNLKSNVSLVDKAEVTISESEDRTECGHSEIDMQTHETEAVVEKSVEVNITENDKESWSKLIPREKAAQSVSYERIQSTTEDVAVSVSTDAANLKSIVSLMDKAEVATSESEDAHMTDVGSGFGVPSAEEITDEVKSHIDGLLSENRSSEQKETTSPKSQAYDFIDADAKEKQNSEEVQVPAFKNSAAADSVLEQSTSEVSDRLSSECMNFNERKTSIIANSEFSELEGNVDNRRSEDPNIYENKSPDISQVNTMEVQHSCHVESSDGSQCKFELQSLPDKSDAFPRANLQTISGEFSSHSEENILSTPSSSAVKPSIKQGSSAVVEEHIVSEQEKYEKFDKSASPDANMQTVSRYSSHGELPIHSEEFILPMPSSSAVKPPITQVDSPVIEHIVSGNEKCWSDKSDASPDANVQTISNIFGCGELPSHREENILSTPSQSAAKPPITEVNSPMVEEHIVSEKEKHKSDRADVSPDANMCTVSNISGYGELPSLSEENILSTPSSSAVKPPITQGGSLMVEEHNVSEKENYELPSQSEKTVMSESSPSVVKPPIKQRDSPVVEEPIGFEEKYKSDKSDASPCSNMLTVSSNSDCGELPSQSKENIMSTPSSPAVKAPITQVDSPMVEEHIVSEEEKFKSEKLDASPGANIQTVPGELPNHIGENILSTPSSSAVKLPVTQDDSPVVEEHVCVKKYKSDKSGATLDVNMHTISSIHGELPSYREESILSTPSSLAVKPPIAKGDSPVVEDHIVSEEKKYKCDKSEASLDANMQTVSSIFGYGELPSHSEEHILSTPSPSAVKPSITQGNSPVVEQHIVSGKEKYTSDKSEASAANMQIVSSVSGKMPSHMEEKILSTPSSPAVKLKPPIAQGDSPVVEEQIVFEKEKYKSDNLEASPNANMQTVSSNSGYGELPSHSEENILSISPSAVKPPNTQGDSPVVEERIVSKREKDKSDYSNESPDANKHPVSGISGEFSSHSEKNVMPTPSPSDVKPSGYKIDAIKHIIPDSNKRIATEDDKGFSFEIRKRSDMSDNNTFNQMKSFPDVSSSESPKTPIEITKGTSEKKSTKPRAKSTKGTPTRKKSTESAGISCTTPSASVGTVSSAFQSDEVKLKAESSRKRKFGSPIIQTSSLPDLNSSVSASTLVHQPFSDIQQVELRAQIFVYGSLIQGIPPDEACMQSAFGDKDGGKSIWETVWRKSVDRYQTQKSPANQETPLLSHSVVRTPNQETKCSSSQSKVSDTSASKFVGKPIAPAIPSTPLSAQSPVWNMTPNFPRAMQLDFNKASTPLHPYPSSQTRQFTNNSTPWLPSNPRLAQWAISSQSPALKSATQYSSVLAVDTVKVTPIRESSMPHNSFIPSPVPVSIPLESQGKTASAQKSRKRKKALVIEDVSKTILVSQTTPTSVVPRSLPTLLPIAPLTSNTPLKVTTEPIVETVPHISPPTASSSCQITNTVNDAQIAKFSEETGNKVQLAKLHAEEAASIAASVVSHGQVIWNQVAAHKNSSVPIEIETKLASVAAAAAAAASVAKAASSAAKVAFEAVVQAKVMADDAINAAKTGNNVQNTGANFDATKNLAMLTPGSILKGKDKMHGSSTIISAACDAAQKRVVEASAASKRAENLNAIMKAAELAAEAVSHVGTIIAMGDPLPFKLSELVEAGPEGSWKSFNKANKLKELEQPEKASVSNQETYQTALKDAEQRVEAEDNCDGSERRVGKSSTLSNDGHEKGSSILEEIAFRKGSLVEVISDEDGLKGGWFSARVLDVADKKVHVCYNNLLSDDGPEQLKEWVLLDSEINGAPRIRIAHPGIVTKNEGTKKRRREADNYVWEVGDHVDAWMRDGWWEGIIIEKNQLDETKLTVHFPAGDDSSLVRAWDLRTSLSWKDGQWTEWSRAEASKPHEGDTPQEKRRKVTQLETKTDAKADGKVANKELSSKIPEMAEASRSLNLSMKDTIFSLGKKEDNRAEVLKGKRTGPHKEGPGVVFGVPKGPGKKQKFMEVSKHYSTDKSNHGKEKDSLKFPKYLMPQPSQPWRNTSKVDSRGKRAVDTKSTSVKSTRASNSNARNVKQKDSSNNTSVTSASNDENPDKNYREDSVSSRPGSTESLVAAPNTSKKKPLSVNEGDRGVKRRFTPSNAGFKSAKKAEVSEGETSDANEPRRSTRKIQPTSRLLEGLQSSMMMSRIPSFSQGKSSKTPHRSSSSRGKTHG